MQTKKFKILDKEPYKFTSKAGQVYDKCRYKTDSEVLDIFAMNLEVGQSYDFEEQEKEFKGKMYKNWVLAKPKSSLELRIEVLEKKVEAMWGAKESAKSPIDKVNAELAREEKEVNLAEIPF